MQVTRWSARTTLLGLTLLAGACGGGDHDPTGPGGGGGIDGTWTLVGINEDGLPESEPMVWGSVTFQSGALRLSQAGEWEMTIQFEHDENGQAAQAEDHGQYNRQGDDLTFASQAFGDHIDGGLDDGFVYMIYDFDGDGEYETEFTFER